MPREDCRLSAQEGVPRPDKRWGGTGGHRFHEKDATSSRKTFEVQELGPKLTKHGVKIGARIPLQSTHPAFLDDIQTPLETAGGAGIVGCLESLDGPLRPLPGLDPVGTRPCQRMKEIFPRLGLFQHLQERRIAPRKHQSRHQAPEGSRVTGEGEDLRK